MLTVATQSSAPPYLAVTAGPASHSPPPMADAPITRPGPIIARMFRQVKIGASISSPVSHRGIAWLPGCGASNCWAGGLAVSAVDAVAVISNERERGFSFGAQSAAAYGQRPMMGDRGSK